eukprot:scaffold1236_cov170-Ochromonas_danica.AAC.26
MRKAAIPWRIIWIPSWGAFPLFCVRLMDSFIRCQDEGMTTEWEGQRMREGRVIEEWVNSDHCVIG